MRTKPKVASIIEVEQMSVPSQETPMVESPIVVTTATPKTDAKLRKKYMKEGYKARMEGRTRNTLHDGMVAEWWYEGYDSI